MSSTRLVPLLFLVGCAHGSSVRVSSSSEFTRIAPGTNYEGTEERIDRSNALPFVGPTRFRFFGQAGQRVHFKYLTRTSEGIGRSLRLRLVSGPTTVPLKSDKQDDFDADTGVLPADGDYELECSPGVVGRGATADFRLEFTADVTKPVIALVENQTIKGELTADDRTDFGGVPTDLYRITMDGHGKRLAFVTRAEGTKLHVVVQTIEEGAFPDLEDEKWGSSSEESHVTYVAEGALIKISGPSGKPLGPYELTVMDARAHQLSKLDLVRLGGEAEGAIDASGDATFRIHGKVGQVYELVATSENTDLVLVVTNAEFFDRQALRVVEDDNSGGGTNPRLRLSLPDEQDWMVLVRNKSKSPGRFKLSFDLANLTQQGPAPQSPQVIQR